MRLRNISAKILSLCGAAAMLVVAGTDASAQRWQYIYGGDQPEAGRGGVRPVSEGGYIAVGESFTPSGGGNSDIYIVRTHDDGSLFWSQTYDIRGNDSATDVEEVFQDGDGGFIVTGVTDGNCLGNRDIFLLRIDRCGNVIWLKTYGTPETEEIGWDVIEAEYGNDEECGTGVQPGDFVVAGATARVGGGPWDAYLIRTNSGGNLIWTRTYDGECQRDDYFYGLIEIKTDAQGGVLGDLVAVGGSNSWCKSGFGNTDALIARVRGCDGKPDGVANRTVSIYGGKYDEALRSVTEITVIDECYGNLAYTGFTDVPDESGNIQRDVYLLQTKADPCAKVGDLVIGDSRSDEGYYIREVPADHPDAGQLVVTGYMMLPNGLGGRDVFLQRFEPCNFGIIAPFTRLFGGERRDWGWSVEPVLESLPCRTAGYIVTGFTNSFTGEDQLYLIKTDLNLKSGCNESEAEPHRREGHEGRCVDPFIEERGEECDPEWQQECQFWQEKLCYDPMETEFCRLEPCECTHGLQKKADAVISFNEAGSVRSYPNPVTRGGTIALEYTMLRDGDASVTVSDITGRVVYTGSNSFKAGTHTIPVSTEGWGVGTYVVKLSMGDRSATTRVIVMEK